MRTPNGTRRKRHTICNATVDLLAGNDPLSIQQITQRLKETLPAINGGKYKLSIHIVAQALRINPRLIRFHDKRKTMYRYE